MKIYSIELKPNVYRPILFIFVLIGFAIILYAYISNNKRYRFYRSPKENLESYMIHQTIYHKDNGIYATIEELAISTGMDLRFPVKGHKAFDLMIPTSDYYAIIISPIKYGLEENKEFDNAIKHGIKFNNHFIATSSGHIRYITVKNHKFHNMPSTQATIKEINLLPLYTAKK